MRKTIATVGKRGRMGGSLRHAAAWAAVALLLYWRMPADAQPPRPFGRDFVPAIAANYARVFRQPQALGFLFFPQGQAPAFHVSPGLILCPAC